MGHAPTVSRGRLGNGNSPGDLTLAGDQRTRSFPGNDAWITVTSPYHGSLRGLPYGPFHARASLAVSSAVGRASRRASEIRSPLSVDMP